MENFNREERYVVFKRKDINRLSKEHAAEFSRILSKLFDLQIQLEMPKREYVVVESDWPEYEPTWRAIEKRACCIGCSGSGNERVIGSGNTEIVDECSICSDRPSKNQADKVIQQCLSEIYGHVPPYTKIKDGSDGWAFWINELDSNSYVRKNLFVEWHGSSYGEKETDHDQ